MPEEEVDTGESFSGLLSAEMTPNDSRSVRDIGMYPGQSTEPRAAVSESGDNDRSGFRVDIEGLRAVAVGLVLLYHAGVRQMPGGFVGVDVFFVISGFLITGHLVRELETSGRVSLTRFYARRAKRLLPATAAVLVASAVLTWRFLPVTDRSTVAGDTVAAALYVVNWRLRAEAWITSLRGVRSAVQHFWSLAVEEQFYVVWPLLLGSHRLVGEATRRRRSRANGRRRRSGRGALARVVGPSDVPRLRDRVLRHDDSPLGARRGRRRGDRRATLEAPASHARHRDRAGSGSQPSPRAARSSMRAPSGQDIGPFFPRWATAAVIVAGFSTGGGGAARLLS